MNKASPNITLSVDIRKCRIRLHKAMLNELGNPKYIQLLVNQEKMILAIRAVDGKVTGDYTHQINYNLTNTDQSIELYSELLVTKIYQLAKLKDNRSSFRIEGKISEREKVAFFSLLNMDKYEI